MSSPLRPVLTLTACSALLACAYACTGAFNVGSIAERSEVASQRSAIDAFRLETVATFQSSDSPSVVWSADGETIVYAEQYAARMYSYNLFDQTQQVVYDGNMGASNPGVQDLLWNVTGPAFLNSNEVISGPSYASTLDDQSAWLGALVVDVVNKTARPFGASGGKPRVNADHTRVLLESHDGLRLTDAQGQELARFPLMCNARWAPDGETFVALQYENYCGERNALVHVNQDGAIETLASEAWEPAWSPDGKGVAFTRAMAARGWFDPAYEFGTVLYVDLENKKPRAIAENARTPVFLPEPRLLMYETMQGIGLSDFEGNRVLRDQRLTDLVPSPDGSHLAAIRQVGDYYYPTAEITVYSVSTD